MPNFNYDLLTRISQHARVREVHHRKELFQVVLRDGRQKMRMRN